MKKLEKEIEEASYAYASKYSLSFRDVLSQGFRKGAKSEESKEFHTHALKIEMVAKCAKMQVDLKKNLYTEEEVKELIYLYTASNTFFKVKTTKGLLTYIHEWFEINKKQL